MFERVTPKTTWGVFLQSLDLVFISTVRATRGQSENAVIAILNTVMMLVFMMFLFYLMFEVLGRRTSPVRGDFVIFLFSGIFLFLIHIQTVTSVAGVTTARKFFSGPTNAFVEIVSTALSALYRSVLALLVCMVVYIAVFGPLDFYDFFGFMKMVVVAWLVGVAIGLFFIGGTPWAPRFFAMLLQVYRRVQMIASGKFFLANSLPDAVLQYFTWNPLFHIIDQARGYAFLNYNPLKTEMAYPLQAAAVFFIVGIMAEFASRKFK